MRVHHFYFNNIYVISVRIKLFIIIYFEETLLRYEMMCHWNVCTESRLLAHLSRYAHCLPCSFYYIMKCTTCWILNSVEQFLEDRILCINNKLTIKINILESHDRQFAEWLGWWPNGWFIDLQGEIVENDDEACDWSGRAGERIG